MAVVLTAVRRALADRCVPQVFNVYAFEPQEDRAEDYPAVWVRPPAIERDAMGPGVWLFTFEMVVAVGEGYDESAQAQADELIVALWDLIEGDDALTDSINGSVIVKRSAPIRPGETVTYQGAELTVEVITNV